jgi:L,D-peptidoglycan transpeptidase YkuD (ErfK/YbiS/YcfS/YnhG family)
LSFSSPKHVSVTLPVSTLRVYAISPRATRGILKLGELAFPCSLGRSGARHIKREGDGASPRGSWGLRRLFYRADRIMPPRTGLKPLVMRVHDGWCETVGDRNYNRLVRIPYATSHETMQRADHLYDIVVELSHNERPRVQGHGSAVFFHLRQPDGGPTAGCIAVSLRDMRTILAHVGRKARLVI